MAGKRLDPLSISLLGIFRISIGEEEIQTGRFRLRKSRQLVKLLALAPDHRLHREQLMELLWPDFDPEAAANNLHQALYAARRALGSPSELPGGYLLYEDENLSLNPGASIWIDVDAFEQAAAGARRGQAPRLYQAALELYAGDLLPEDPYEEWTITRRESLRQEYLGLLRELGEIFESRGEYQAGIETFQKLVQVDLSNEAAYTGLMRLYALNGQRQLALRQYQTLQEALRNELDIEPEPGSTRLYQDILAGAFPSPSAKGTPPGLAVPSQNPSPGMTDFRRLPIGTVTFLFSDIEASTPRWESHPEQMREALQIHNAVLHQAVAAQEGVVFKIVGDAFLCAFFTAQQALEAAIGAQRDLQAAAWNELGPLHIRIGLHTGEAHLTENGDDYAVAHTLNRAARIVSAGYGGQILLSSETAELCAAYLPQDVHLSDLGKHFLKGLERAEHLYQVLAPGLRQDYPPLATQNKIEHNLPVQLTGFIGREQEMAQVEELVAHHRLVTLTGSGGVGKTRLCLQVAERVLERFPDGVWYVELASVSDPELVPQVVARTFGLREEAGLSMLDSMVYFLKDRQVLLILDNGEHLLEACAHLADTLLRKTSQLKILATSREVLGITGEMVFRVPSLTVPDPQRIPSLAEFIQYEAVRLFCERARSVLPSFQVDEVNAPAIAQICQQLDGIPLALELAAARLNLLTTEQLARRLGDAFRLLTGGSRTALPRQQTLRAAIDWSYQLLSESERRLLCRMAVFAGGGSLEAIEEICSGAGLDAGEILKVLGGLVNKSMVRAERQQHAESRYRLLETVRQYAGEKLSNEKLSKEKLSNKKSSGENLEAANEKELVQDRHLSYYLRLAEEIEPQLRTPVAVEKLQVLNREIDNLRAALIWAMDGSSTLKTESGLRLACALYNFWLTENYFLEGYTWLEKGFSLLPVGEPLFFASRAKASLAAGSMLCYFGRYLESQQWLEGSLEMYHKIGDIAGLSMAQSLLGQFLAWADISSSRAKALCEQSLATARTLHNPWLLAWVLFQCGTRANSQKDYTLAWRLLTESLSIFERLGDWIQIGGVFSEIGRTFYLQGEYAEARSYLNKAVTAYQSIRSSGLMGGALGLLGAIACMLDEFEQMETNFRLAQERFRQGGLRFPNIWILRGLGIALKRQGRPSEAVACYLESLSLALEADDHYGIYAAIAGIAGSVILLGEALQVARLLGTVEALFSSFIKPLEPWELREYDRDVAAAKTALSEEAFIQAWAEGHSLALDDAIREALDLGSKAKSLKISGY